MMLCAVFSLQAMAQSGLHVEKLFDGRFRKHPNAVEIVVTGKSANELRLTTYRSVVLTGESDMISEIEALVVKDGLKSVAHKEVSYRGGKVYYAFYTLKPLSKKINRYLFYLNENLNVENPKDRVTIIYMDGWADADYIKGLIKK